MSYVPVKQAINALTVLSVAIFVLLGNAASAADKTQQGLQWSNALKHSKDQNYIAGNADHAVILQYHHVGEDTPAVTSISPRQFKRHLDWLAEHHFVVLPLEDIVRTLQSGKTLPDRAVAITFDDGYLNIYNTAYPMLVRHGYPFTVFLNTQAIDDKYATHFSWEQARIMQEQGASFGNHSANHPFMLRREAKENRQQWRQRIKAEVTKAQQRIDKELGKQPRLFAYPYGESDSELQTILQKMGYISFGQHSGPIDAASNFNNLPRFPLSGAYSDLDTFAIKMFSLPFPGLRDNSKLATVIDYEIERPVLEFSLSKDQTWIALQCFASGQGRANIDMKSNYQFSVQAAKPVPIGRSRYNCTHPSKERITDNSGEVITRYFWFSKQWIRRGPNQQWQHQ